MIDDSLPLFLITGEMEGWSGPIGYIVVAALSVRDAINRVTFGSDSMVQSKPEALVVEQIGTIYKRAAELIDPHPYISSGFVICST